MQTKKMSLANIQGKLSRAEMKKIMAGSEGGNVRRGICNGGGAEWYYPSPVDYGTCSADIQTHCGSIGGGCFTTY